MCHVSFLLNLHRECFGKSYALLCSFFYVVCSGQYSSVHNAPPAVSSAAAALAACSIANVVLCVQARGDPTSSRTHDEHPGVTLLLLLQ